MTFLFGQSLHERIAVDVLGYERVPVGDYHDDNWLAVRISVLAGGFHGKVEAAILTGELVGFLTQLRPLYERLSGTAEFTTLEEQLHLRLSGDGKGYVELTGEVADQCGIGNQLRFKLQIDQAQLGISVRELERVVSEFPVRAG